MTGWATFWAGTLIVLLAIFAGLAVVVSIGGYRDLVTMLREMSQEISKDDC